jgi:hypothetical protein
MSGGGELHEVSDGVQRALNDCKGAEDDSRLATSRMTSRGCERV